MLAVKRALSIVLSLLLTTPSVSFARKQNNSGLQKIPFVVQGGKPVSIVEKRGKGNKLKSRTITSSGYSEMILDENNDGLVDKIEVRRNGTITTASMPYRGRFTRVDVERKLKSGGIYKAKLYLSRDRKRYQVVSSNVFADGKFPATAAVPAPFANQTISALNSHEGTGAVGIGALIQCADPQRISSLPRLISAIEHVQRTTGQSVEDIIDCKLRQLQHVLFDRTCQAGEWRDSMPAMIRGLARVMASSFTQKAGENERGEYLTCLSRHGWAPNALRVQDHIWRNFQDVSNVLAGHGVSLDDFTRLMSDTSRRCEPIDTSGTIGGRTFNFTPSLSSQQNADGTYRRNAPAVTCSPTPNGARTAEFQNGQIRLFSPQDLLQRQSNCTGCQVEAYASTFFHELLHASGFNHNDHEAIVENAEKCCAVMPTDRESDKANACKFTAQNARILDLLQRNQAVMSQLMVGYNENAALLDREFAPHGETMLNEYTQNINRAIGPVMATIQRNLQTCEPMTGAERESCRETQFAYIQREIRTQTAHYFRVRCPDYARVARGDAANACETHGSRFLAMLDASDRQAQSTAAVALPSFNATLGSSAAPTTFGGGNLFEELFGALSPEFTFNTDPLVDPAQLQLDLFSVAPELPDLAFEKPFSLPASTLARTYTFAGMQPTSQPRFAPTSPSAAVANPSVPSATEQESQMLASRPQPVTPTTRQRIGPPDDSFGPIYEPVQPPPVTGTSVTTGTFRAVQPAPAQRTAPPRVAAPSQPARTEPVAAAPSSTTGTFRAVGSAETARPSPALGTPNAFTSGVSMPVASSERFGVGSPTRADGITGERITPLTGTVRRLSDLGDQVMRAAVPEATARERRLAQTQPARQVAQQTAQPAAQAPPPAQPQAQLAAAQVAAPPLAAAQLQKIETNFAIRAPSSLAANSMIAQPVPLPSRGENSSLPAQQRQGRQNQARNRPQEKVSRSSSGGASSGSSTGSERSVASAQAGGEEERSSATSAGGGEREVQGEDGNQEGSRELAEAKVEGAPAKTRGLRSVARLSRTERARYQGIRDVTGWQRYVSQIPREQMANYLVDTDFVRNLKVGVQNPNGRRVGAPHPAPLMVPCRDRYVTEGFCR